MEPQVRKAVEMVDYAAASSTSSGGTDSSRGAPDSEKAPKCSAIQVYNSADCQKL